MALFDVILKPCSFINIFLRTDTGGGTLLFSLVKFAYTGAITFSARRGCILLLYCILVSLGDLSKAVASAPSAKPV